MNETRKLTLAGPALTQDKHRRIRLRHLAGRSQHRLHLGALRHQLGGELLNQPRVARLRPALLRQPPDPHPQLVERKGFGQVVRGSGLHCLHRAVSGAERRHHHDFRRHLLAARGAQDGQPVHLRHAEVRHHHIEAARRQSHQSFSTTAGAVHLVPVALECLAHDPSELRLVVDHQHLRHQPPLPSLGNHASNVAPDRLSSSSRKVPPWRSTIRRDNANPRPVPRSLLVTNGSKSRARISAATPGPLSRTTTASPPFIERAVTSTVPTCCACAALVSRLVNTWRSRAVSASTAASSGPSTRMWIPGCSRSVARAASRSKSVSATLFRSSGRSAERSNRSCVRLRKRSTSPRMSSSASRSRSVRRETSRSRKSSTVPRMTPRGLRISCAAMAAIRASASARAARPAASWRWRSTRVQRNATNPKAAAPTSASTAPTRK